MYEFTKIIINYIISLSRSHASFSPSHIASRLCVSPDISHSSLLRCSSSKKLGNKDQTPRFFRIAWHGVHDAFEEDRGKQTK